MELHPDLACPLSLCQITSILQHCSDLECNCTFLKNKIHATRKQTLIEEGGRTLIVVFTRVQLEGKCNI